MASADVLFNAVTGSVRQIYLLLRSIQFATKAHVSITESGLHFSTEDSRVMQGSVLIEKSLFSSYSFKEPSEQPDQDGEGEEHDEAYNFQINLPAMLETLQVLGLSEAGNPPGGRDNSGISAAIARGGPANALSNRVLGTAAICRISYLEDGAPLNIVLEENSLTTTCALTTYEPETDLDGDIPLHRDRLIFKVIMKASLLLDAIAELDSTSPVRLAIAVSPQDPNLVFSAVGPHSSASVELRKDKQLLETFNCGGASTNSYKFSMIKAASRAMAMSSKVSIRADENGVLSLQFMVEGDGPGNMSFIDFKFRALIEEEAEEEESDGDGDGEYDEDGLEEGEESEGEL